MSSSKHQKFIWGAPATVATWYLARLVLFVGSVRGASPFSASIPLQKAIENLRSVTSNRDILIVSQQPSCLFSLDGIHTHFVSISECQTPSKWRAQLNFRVSVINLCDDMETTKSYSRLRITEERVLNEIVDLNETSSIWQQTPNKFQRKKRLSGSPTHTTSSFYQFENPTDIDLQGETLRVSAVKSDLYDFDTSIDIIRDGSPVLRECFVLEILEALQFSMNFKSVLKVTHSWGLYDKVTSKWDGMIADLVNGQADLAISSLAETPMRRLAVDFNTPTYSLQLSAFFVAPKSTGKISGLLHPFRTEVWTTIFLWVALLTITLLAFANTTRYLTINNAPRVRPIDLMVDSWSESSSSLHSVRVDLMKKDEIDSRTWDNMECWVMAIASVCSRGFYAYPKNDGHRIVVSMGYFMGLALMAAYGGTLISFLSVVQETIRSFDGLLTSRFRLIASKSEMLFKSILEDSTVPVLRETLRRMEFSNDYNDILDAKSELFMGSFAFIATDVGAYHKMRNSFSSFESCSIRELHVPFFPVQNQGTIVPKNSPLKQSINYNILKMKQIGMLIRLRQKYIPGEQNNERYCTRTNSFDGVQFESVAVAFGILSVGALMSLIALFIEYWPHRSKI